MNSNQEALSLHSEYDTLITANISQNCASKDSPKLHPHQLYKWYWADTYRAGGCDAQCICNQIDVSLSYTMHESLEDG